MQRARTFLSQFLRKFVHEGLPVALASAIGTMVFGQFNHPSAPRPLAAVQERAGEAILQMVREEHALVLDLLNREAETKRVAISGQDKTLEANKVVATPDERAAKTRRMSAAKAAPLPAAKTIHPTSEVAGDPLPLAPRSAAPEAPGPAVASKPEPQGSSGPTKIFELLSRAARLPSRLWDVKERLIDDLPGATLPSVPMAGRQLGPPM
jgi:hypothetical protein